MPEKTVMRSTCGIGAARSQYSGTTEDESKGVIRIGRNRARRRRDGGFEQRLAVA